MAVATSTMILAGLAASAAAYQVKQSNDARKDAQAAADKQQAEQNRIAADANAKMQAEQERAGQAASLLKARGQRPASSPNILTSPLGAPGMASSVGGKTMLGQ